MWYALAMSCTISGTLPRLSLGAFDNKTTCMLKKVKTTQNNEKMNNSRSHYGWIPDNRTDRRMQRRVQLLLCRSDCGSGGAGVATAGNEDNWFLTGMSIPLQRVTSCAE